MEPFGQKTRAWEKQMGLLLDDFRDVFNGIDKYYGAERINQIKENVSPVIQPARRIPFYYVKPLEDHIMMELIVEGPLEEEKNGTWISKLVTRSFLVITRKKARTSWFTQEH